MTILLYLLVVLLGLYINYYIAILPFRILRRSWKPLHYLTTRALAIVSELRLTLYSQAVNKEQVKVYNIHSCFRLFFLGRLGMQG